jgi:hypothetical protein
LDWTSRGVENCEQRVVGRRAHRTGSGASVIRYWALRLGREAPPCILSSGRKGVSGERAGESNGRAAIWGPPHKATATALQYELKNGKALGSGRQ